MSNIKSVFNEIMAYENGELTDDEVVHLFSTLIKTGMAYQLQGSYGRTARALIENGMLDAKGNIINHPDLQTERDARPDKE